MAECVEAYLILNGAEDVAEFERLLETADYQEAAEMAVTSFAKGIEKAK